jgi:mycothiol synthase
VATELFGATVDHACGHGGGPINLWVYGDSASARSLARRFEFSPARELLQLRLAALPGEEPPTPEGIVMATFRPDHDAKEWLEVNNRAFSWHPENGGWTMNDLETRIRTDWFDPRGFLIARDAGSGKMAGFCWTKHHDGSVGEIYIVATDPEYQGRGLGRFLTCAGLATLARGRAKSGMLYVDAENTAARRLYRDLGFVHDHTDTCWRREICA